MLTPSPRRCVVFTQGYPFLADFARRHFLPQHPLSSSPLWLDENDFTMCQQTAARRGVASPLRINPLSHHPELSPYAQKRKATKGARGRTKGGHAGGRGHDNGAVGHPEGGRGGENALAKRPCQHSTEKLRGQSTRSFPHAERRYNVPICSLDVHRHMHLYNLDQMKLAYYDTVNSADTNTTTTTASLFFSSNDPGERERQQLQEGLAPSHQRPVNMEEKMRHAAAALTLSNAPPLYDVRAATSTSMDHGSSTSDNAWMAADAAAREQEGVQALRARFPNPGGGLTMAATTAMAFSIKSNRPYTSTMQADLARLTHLHGYRSQYWGTAAQWQGLGAQPQHKQQPHLVYLPYTTKLVHISLIEDAEELLRRSFISGKSGTLSPMWNLTPDILRRVRDTTIAGEGGAGEPSPCLPVAQNHLPFGQGVPVSDGGWLATHEQPSHARSTREAAEADMFYQAVLEDMLIHKYQFPLYFSGRQLLTHRLSLKPNAAGIDVRARKAQQFLLDAMREGGGWGDGLFPLTVESAYGGGFRHEGKGGSGASSSSATAADGRLPRSTPAIAEAMGGLGLGLGVPVVHHYYHLSQVHFPAGFTIPLRVVTAELESNEGVALHGVSGQVLPFTELAVESVRNTYPELAAVLLEQPQQQRAKESAEETAEVESEEHELDILDILQRGASGKGINTKGGGTAAPFVDAATRKEQLLALSDEDFAALVRARTDPANISGRSLWFLADDVLKLDGIVDVNAAPVEVRDTSGGADAGAGGGGGGLDSAGGGALVSPRALFNVECLVNPDEGFRMVNQRIPGTDGLH